MGLISSALIRSNSTVAGHGRLRRLKSTIFALLPSCVDLGASTSRCEVVGAAQAGIPLCITSGRCTAVSMTTALFVRLWLVSDGVDYSHLLARKRFALSLPLCTTLMLLESGLAFISTKACCIIKSFHSCISKLCNCIWYMCTYSQLLKPIILYVSILKSQFE